MKKTFTAAVAVLLSVIAVFFSGCDALTNMATEEETTLPFSTSRTEQPDSKAGVVAYYNQLIELAREGKAGVSRDEKYSINDLKIVKRASEGVTDEDGNQVSDPELDTLNAAAKEVKSFIAKGIKSKNISAAFGEDWGEAAPNTISSENYVSDAKCVMGEQETSEDNKEIVYTNYYYGDLVFKNENYPLAANSCLAPVFPYPDEEAIKAELAKMSDYIVLEDYDCTFEDNKISFSSERTLDEIDYANYCSNVKITAHAKGVGKLAGYGELTVLLTLRCENNYTFDWVDPNEVVTEAK